MQGIMPPTLDNIIETAAGFDDRTFALINELVQRPTSTDPSDADVSELSKASDVSEDDIRYFLSFLDFLFARTADIEPSDLDGTLVSFLEENGSLDDPTQLATRLANLLQHREIQDAATKQARLRDGLLPNITSLANFVDLRSDFKRDDNGELTGELGEAVTIIQLGIQTNSARENQRQLILQLDERTLGRLEDCISEIRKKLKILSDQ
ncbi:MAG: hypothetical protein QNI90_18740 [Dinoroseobacter sp.]|nr:hypothetical protein [Dinoroseobacter sp.]